MTEEEIQTLYENDPHLYPLEPELSIWNKYLGKCLILLLFFYYIGESEKKNKKGIGVKINPAENQ